MADGPPMLSELVEALTIFLKYGDVAWPTHCEHDEMVIANLHECATISPEDHTRLEELGFGWDEDDERYKSYAFGSA